MVFLSTVVILSANMGMTLINNAPQPPTIPPQPTGLDYIGYLFGNMGYFFELMTMSSSFFVFGVVLLTPFIVTMLWAILELIRGV